MNVFWLQLTGSPIVVNDLKAVADEIAALWATDVAPHVTNDCSLTGVDISYIPAAGSVTRYTGAYSNVGGLATASVDAASACAVIDFVISARYRGGHPRLYQAGVAQTSITNGSDYNPPDLNALVTGWNNLRNSLNAFTSGGVTGIVMGTVRFVHNKAWLTPPLFSAYTSTKAGKKYKLGQQRRRILS